MKPIAAIVVDANALLAGVLGGAGAKRILFHPLAPAFYAAAPVMTEVEAYLPRLAQRRGLSLALLQAIWRTIPIVPLAVHRDTPAWDRAWTCLGSRDPDDVPTLALALHHGWPIWSQDRDFEIARHLCVVYPTALLLQHLDAAAGRTPSPESGGVS